MLERMWRKGNSPLLLVGMSAGTATVENSMEVPQKTKNRTTILFSSPTPRHISNKTIIQTDNIHPYVQSSTIHDSQDMETTLNVYQ